MKADREIAKLRAQLAVIERQREGLEKRLGQLTSHLSSDTSRRTLELIADGPAQVLNTSPVHEKVALFRRLFAGRTDVYPQDIPVETP